MFWRIVGESLSGQRAAHAVSFSAIALGTTVVTTLVALSLDVGDKVMREMAAGQANIVVRAAGGDRPLSIGGVLVEGPAGTLPVESLGALTTFFWKNNVLAFTPVLTVAAATRGPAGGPERIAVNGTWFDRPVPEAPWMRAGMAALGRAFALEGRWPAEGPGVREVLVGRRLATRLGLATGGTLRLERGGRTLALAVTGVGATGGPEDDEAFTGLDLVWGWSGRPGVVGRILVEALTSPETRLITALRRDPRSLSPQEYDRWYCTPYPSSIARRLSESIAGAEARPLWRASSTHAAVVGRLQALFLAVSLLALIVASLGVASTLSACVVARATEVGLMKALGASAAGVAALFLTEAGILAVAGGTLGFGAGSLLAHATALELFGTGTGLKPALLAASLGLALVVTLGGALAPLLALVRLDPVHALRGR